jgi:hypothetical protein
VAQAPFLCGSEHNGSGSSALLYMNYSIPEYVSDQESCSHLIEEKSSVTTSVPEPSPRKQNAAPRLQYLHFTLI